MINPKMAKKSKSGLKSRPEFLWGAATSGHQVEGGNTHSDWWAWEKQGNIEGGVSSGKATNHWKLYKEDIRRIADLGLNSYRFSVEWSRLEPEEGKWSKAAADVYLDMISECEKFGIIPMMTLHHFTSPQWFAQQGGFVKAKSVKQFSNFVERCVETFGARVPIWCTINEPLVMTLGGYLGKFMPPAKSDPKLVAKVIHHLLKSHTRAYDLIHKGVAQLERKGPFREHPLEVGFAHNMIDFCADRRGHPIETVLAFLFSRFYNRAWLDAVCGKRPKFRVPGFVPEVQPIQELLGQPRADFIGVNYYTKAYISWAPRGSQSPEAEGLPFGVNFAHRKEQRSDLDWAIHPDGLLKMLRIAGKYRLPVYVTENGIADKEDRFRSRYIALHLKRVIEARKQGIDVRGYYYWSLLDNFEWVKGFWPRFGLYFVDYETFERKETASARKYRQLVEAHKGKPPKEKILERFFQIG